MPTSSFHSPGASGGWGPERRSLVDCAVATPASGTRTISAKTVIALSHRRCSTRRSGLPFALWKIIGSLRSSSSQKDYAKASRIVPAEAFAVLFGNLFYQPEYLRPPILSNGGEDCIQQGNWSGIRGAERSGFDGS